MQDICLEKLGKHSLEMLKREHVFFSQRVLSNKSKQGQTQHKLERYILNGSQSGAEESYGALVCIDN